MKLFVELKKINYRQESLDKQKTKLKWIEFFFFIGNNKLINVNHFRGGSTLIQRKQEIPNQLLVKIPKPTTS